MASSDLRWSWSPANSRLVRGLLYLFAAVLGGMFIFSVYTVALAFINGHLPARFLPIALVSLLVLIFLVYWSPRFPAFQRAFSQNIVLQEFAQERQPNWIVIAALLGGGVYVFIMRFAPVALFVWVLGGLFVSMVGARMLSSEGAIDPETRTLEYNGNEINLNFLTDVDRLSVGERTLLWLSFEPGCSNLPQRLYVVPTSVVDQGWEVFQSGIDQSVETVASNRSLRILSVIGALSFGGVAVGLFALLSWADAPPALSILAALMFAVFGLAFGSVAIRSV